MMPTPFSILRSPAEGPSLIIRHLHSEAPLNALASRLHEDAGRSGHKSEVAVRFIRPIDAAPGVRRGDTVDRRSPIQLRCLTNAGIVAFRTPVS
jgi:hypothetical protein